jgi:Lactoylglutathione lyase and related lyases
MSLFTPTSLILYVEDVAASTRFYADLLGAGPIAEFEGFAVFTLGSTFTLGLQDRATIDPAPQESVGGTELCLSDTDRETVDRLYAEWSTRGIPMVLDPTELAFGYTFVATDPDGHRLRVCATDTSGLEK